MDGVTRVSAAPARDGVVDLTIETVQGRDLRRELARTVVDRGWGLLELRSLRMSLEEIFLHLTTEEEETDGQDDRVAASPEAEADAEAEVQDE